MAETSRSWRDDRGATLVEYALIVALVALACISALGALQDHAATGYAARSDAISGDAAAPVDPDGEADPPPVVPPVTPPGVSSSCAAATCQMSVTNAPPGSTIDWTTNPSAGTGTGSTFAVTGVKNGGPYTVTATAQPSGQTVTKTVTCTKGNNPVCTAA